MAGPASSYTAVLYADRGVRAGAGGAEHVDLRRDGVDRRPFLVVPPVVITSVTGCVPLAVEPAPLGDGAAVFDGTRLRVVVAGRTLFTCDVRQLPDDWWREVRRTGSLELVVPPRRPVDPSDAATGAHEWVTDGRPSLHIPLSPEVADTVRTAREEYTLAAADFPAIAARVLPPPTLPSPPAGGWTLGRMRSAGVLPERYLDTEVPVHVDECDVAHDDRTCHQVVGDTTMVTVPVVRAISTGCPGCGFHQDRPVDQLPFTSLRRELTDVAEVLDHLTRLPGTQAPRWSELLAATVAEVELFRGHHFNETTRVAHLAAGVVAQLRAATHTAAKVLRSHRDTTAVEMAIVFAADETVASRVHTTLASTSTTLADQVVSMLRSGDDPRRHIDELAHSSGLDPHTVSSTIARPADWLDRQRVLLCGPPRLALIPTSAMRGHWPSQPLTRLVMLRYGAVVDHRSGAALVTMPGPVLSIVQAAAGRDECEDLCAVADGDTQSIYQQAIAGNSGFRLKVREHLADARSSHGVLVDDEPVRWRPFFAQEET